MGAEANAVAKVTGAQLKAWRQWAGWDVPETARRLRRAAGDDPHIATHDSLVRQIRRSERNNAGVSERTILLYTRALGITPAQVSGDPPSAASESQGRLAGRPPARGGTDGVITTGGRDDIDSGPDWPVWFGVRLAQLIALVDGWQCPAHELTSLQEVLQQEILMFDAAAPDGPQRVRGPHALSRRQALVTLGTLPLAASGLVSASHAGTAATGEFFLPRCAASLTACWHLLRGSDLLVVEQIVSSYLLALEAVAKQPSRYQQVAAGLASQAHRICGIIALHREQLRARAHHCEQALYYAGAAADAGSRVSALISLASTYFYAAEPARAAAVYERASGLDAGMPRLQRSRVHAELAVVYGQLRREQDALRSAGLAAELYPDHPEQDRSFLYAEFTPASLALEQGLAYMALAEEYPGRRYHQKAAGIFARVDQLAPAPERIRFEIVNHQAQTAILLADLDAFETYVTRGHDGAALLRSRQRRKEIEIAWQRARQAWPRERRLMALSEALQLTAGPDPK
jgi:tetratricopeptide (TPR) repeat protein